MKKIIFDCLSKTLFLAIILTAVTSCNKKTYVAEVDEEYYRIDKYRKSTDSNIDKIILPYQDKLLSQMDEVIGSNESEMRKNKPCAPMNNWMADILLDISRSKVSEHVDFAMQNYGGVRAGLSAGDVTVGKIYEIMPFDNALVLVTAKGGVVKKLFDRVADYGGWPISKNTSFRIDNNKAVDIIVDGEPFDMEKTYTFTLPDYVAQGNDDCPFLIGTSQKELGLLVRDAMIEWMRLKEGPITPNLELRIKL